MFLKYMDGFIMYFKNKILKQKIIKTCLENLEIFTMLRDCTKEKHIFEINNI